MVLKNSAVAMPLQHSHQMPTNVANRLQIAALATIVDFLHFTHDWTTRGAI